MTGRYRTLEGAAATDFLRHAPRRIETKMVQIGVSLYPMIQAMNEAARKLAEAYGKQWNQSKTGGATRRL